jgi:hypothetical protein
MLQNIKPLKLYAWETLVSKRVEEARRRQLVYMLKAAVLKAVTSTSVMFDESSCYVSII